MKTHIQFTINLTPKQKARIAKVSKSLGITQSELIRRAVNYLLIDYPDDYRDRRFTNGRIQDKSTYS